MRAWPFAAVAGAVGGPGILVLLALRALGQVSLAPALIGIAGIGLAAAMLGTLYATDIGRLRRRLGALLQPDGLVAESSAEPILPTFYEISREIARLAQAEARRAEQLLGLQKADAAILESLPDPLIVLGLDRAVRRANAAARSVFGDDLASLLRHPAMRAAIDHAFEGSATSSPGVQRTSLSVKAPARDLEAVVIPVDPPLADGGRAIVVLSDRTRDRAVERMRADFVANASHELRTPLASVMGFIDTLRGPAADDPEAQQRFLGIMAEQAERMSRLIDDLLSLSRIEISEHQAPSEPVDLRDLLNRSIIGIEQRLAARHITLKREIADDLPDVPGDVDQLSQVVLNLLDNAVKYGREGGVVGVAAAPAQGGRYPNRSGLAVTITDDGQGIARQHLPRLTERFYRVDKGRSRAVGGTGLGLAIVKHIVNRHRGQLLIDSEEGVGSRFTFWLPLAADPVRNLPAPEASRAS